MVWSVDSDPKKPKAAIDFFRKKIGISKAEWEAMSEAARRKAFTVAGVANLDLVSDTWEAIDRALDNGTTFADFQEEIGDALESEWAGSVSNPPARLEVIFRTNVQSAYMAGRYEAMTDPAVLKVKPVWMFDAITDDRTSEICEDCNGTILPADDPWWNDHVPPLHHQCRSQVIALTEEQAAEQGGTTDKPTKTDAAEGFGGAPTSKADEWEPDAADYPPALWKASNTKAPKGKR